MSDLEAQAQQTPPVVSYAAARVDTAPTSPLLRAAGVIGLAACMVGLMLLLAGCAGQKWWALAPYVAYAGAAGLGLALLAALVQHKRFGEETHFLLALFINFLAIIGGLIETAVLKGWPLLPK